MATTMTLIGKQTVGSAGATSITFTSIPQTYTDLKIVASVRSAIASNTTSILVRFNGDATSANYTTRYVTGTGSAASSGSQIGNISGVYAGEVNAASSTASVFANSEIYIPNYTSSNQKSVNVDNVTENNATAVYTYLLSSIWTGTAAINRIDLVNYSATTFNEYSTFYLYGISNSQNQATAVPYASGGDVITTDGVYWYHQFLYSGTFTPKKDLVCDYLVVAGGGGGGCALNAANSEGAGGGGAGGLRSTVTVTGGGGTLETPLSLVANYAYTATVGAGGSGGAVSNNNGASGNNSVFATVTSTGGGGGGKSATAGLTGGSGGGGGAGASAPYAGGSGTSNQGYAGGSGSVAGRAGGGGGAGQVGASASSTVIGSGNGGNGVAVSITGSSVTYAGGGGGGGYSNTEVGNGGTGGGGKGGAFSSSLQAQAGTANLGAGGGGASYNLAGGNGGSGIVVVRYAV